MSVRSVSSTYWYVPLQYGYRLPVFECGCQLFQVTVRVVNLERPKCDFASGSPYRNCAFALRHIDTDGGNNSSFHFSDVCEHKRSAQAMLRSLSTSSL